VVGMIEQAGQRRGHPASLSLGVNDVSAPDASSLPLVARLLLMPEYHSYVCLYFFHSAPVPPVADPMH
jgi:hypothetical protein